MDEPERTSVMIERARYPLLFQEQEATFSIGPVRFVFELEPPIPALVSNVRVAAFSGDRVLLIDTREFGISCGQWTHDRRTAT